MTTPPVPPTDAPPTFEDVKAVVVAFLGSVVESGHLKDEVQTLVTNAIHSALTELLAEEGALMLPLTAWANGWMTQIRTDYSPGGILEQMLKNAAHSVKVFATDPDKADKHD